jgi:hypothetical protein
MDACACSLARSGAGHGFWRSVRLCHAGISTGRACPFAGSGGPHVRLGGERPPHRIGSGGLIVNAREPGPALSVPRSIPPPSNAPDTFHAIFKHARFRFRVAPLRISCSAHQTGHRRSIGRARYAGSGVGSHDLSAPPPLKARRFCSWRPERASACSLRRRCRLYSPGWRARKRAAGARSPGDRSRPLKLNILRLFDTGFGVPRAQVLIGAR